MAFSDSHPHPERDPINVALLHDNSSKNYALSMNMLKNIMSNKNNLPFCEPLTESALLNYGTSLQAYVQRAKGDPIDFLTIKVG
jgi:hypothetical protein